MTQEAEKPNLPDQPAEGEKKRARELYEQEIADNLMWRDTTTPERGFVIGGVRAADHGAAEKDPPYLLAISEAVVRPCWQLGDHHYRQ
jgi:hypothetical protein